MSRVDVFSTDLKMLDGLSAERRMHSVAVSRFVAESTRDLDIDRDQRIVLRRAAMLHDVGYAHAVSGMHALDGAAWLAEQGVPADVVNRVVWHSNARHEYVARGIDVDQVAERFGPRRGDLLDAWLFVADFSITPNGKITFIDDRVADIHRRYPSDGPVVAALLSAESDLKKARSQVARSLGFTMM